MVYKDIDLARANNNYNKFSSANNNINLLAEVIRLF
jgi:hypothetical protein